MRSSRSVRAAIAVALTPLALAAQDAQQQRVELHGFGSWNYGSTNTDNLYLGGKKNGTSSNSSLSLNASGALSDRFSVSSQVQLDFVTAGATTTNLDYVFGEWRFTDALKLRAGQVKQPFGIYTEVYDVGTIRPFLALPQSRGTRTRAEGEAVYERMLQFGRELRARDKLVGSESLASLDRAARVQVRGGKPQVVDGPFAEAKEMVGGFFLLDCRTREEALEIARACPAAEWATVEVRETAPCYD